MTNLPALSIVVPVYNGGDYLHSSLSSLLSQTLHEIEIIVVNDASPDPRDRSITKELQKLDRRIRYVELREHVGTGRAREIGITEAKGEFVGFLDSDDYAEPFAYELLYNITTTERCDIGVGDFITVKNNLSIKPRPSPSDVDCHFVSGPELFHRQISRLQCPYYLRIDWWNKIYRRSLFTRHNITFPDVVRNEGTMSIVMSLLAERCVIIDTPMFYTSTLANSVSRKFVKRNISDTINSYLHVKSWIRRLNNYNTDFNDRIINMFMHIIFNINLKLIARGDDLSKFAVILVEEILKNPELKVDLLKYMSNPRNHIERLVLAAISTGKIDSAHLSSIKSTSFYNRLEGGSRLQKSQIQNPVGEKPLVTIITVVKDVVGDGRTKFFNRMLNSVSEQDYGRSNIEHIALDADSKDGTVELLAQSGLDYWVSEPDSGIYPAMNKALTLARGKYVIFLNSDDYLPTHSLKTTIQALEDNSADYCFGNAVKVDANENPVGRHVGDIRKIYFGTPYCHQALVCKRSCFSSVKFDESYKLTMWVFAIDLYHTGLKHIYVDEDVAYFRVGGASTVTQSRLFKEEQDTIKRSVIAPQLDLSIDEYEYLNHSIRKWDTKGFDIEVEEILSKLFGSGDNLKTDFNRKILSLLMKDRVCT